MRGGREMRRGREGEEEGEEKERRRSDAYIRKIDCH